MTQLNFIIDPEVADRVIPSIRVHNMPVRSALNWICRLTGTSWMIKDEAIFITTPEKAGTRSVDLRVFDVRDITTAVTDFPGPEFILGVDGSFGGVGLMSAPPAAEPAIDIADLIQVITERFQGDFSAASNVKATGNSQPGMPAQPHEVWACNIPSNSAEALTVCAAAAPSITELTAAQMKDFIKQNAVLAKDIASYHVQRKDNKLSVGVVLRKDFAAKYRLAASMPSGSQDDKRRLLVFVADQPANQGK